MRAGPVTLAIETSTRSGSVAIAVGGGPPAVRALPHDRRHTAELFPQMVSLASEMGARLRDVELLCYSAGPGSFTGLRVAATVARMMRSVRGVRIVAVSSLEALAHNALRDPGDAACVVPMLDARRGQVFAAAFRLEGGRVGERLLAPGVYEPRVALAAAKGRAALLGDGAALCGDRSDDVHVCDPALWTPSAEAVLEIGRCVARRASREADDAIVPVYIRPPECEEVYEQRREAARARRAGGRSTA